MTCSLCGNPATPGELAEASWLAPGVTERLARRHPAWQRRDGACPACVQEALLTALLDRGDAALHASIQSVWPLDPGVAFGVLPTPLRMHADRRYTGRGVTVALVDSGFHPHPDLVLPGNRIRAWADAARDPVACSFFDPGEAPAWPGSGSSSAEQWHGLMTSATLAGNGWLSHGLYRGLASEADLVLVQARQPDGRIPDSAIARALRWLRDHAGALSLRVVSLSVGGDRIPEPGGNAVDEAVVALVADGVTVIAAAGNDGQRRLVPPATAPGALTIGGIDDKNTFDHADVELWHSNYGRSTDGMFKPELVAPSIWVAAPLLLGTAKADRAARLFALRGQEVEEQEAIEKEISELKLVTPHYHHVDGTSVAAPLVAGVAACMLQANQGLTPLQVRRVLLAAARPVPGALLERQGAGAIDAGQAVSLALRERYGPLAGRAFSPRVRGDEILFTLHDDEARQVQVLGSWDGWRPPGLKARTVGPGLWEARLPLPPAGRHLYKYLLDGRRWLDDPDNSQKSPDGFGRLNSVVDFPGPPCTKF